MSLFTHIVTFPLYGWSSSVTSLRVAINIFSHITAMICHVASRSHYWWLCCRISLSLADAIYKISTSNWCLGFRLFHTCYKVRHPCTAANIVASSSIKNWCVGFVSNWYISFIYFRHVKKSHGLHGEKPMHACKHCGKLFYKFQLLKMHSFDVHKDIMPNTKVGFTLIWNYLDNKTLWKYLHACPATFMNSFSFPVPLDRSTLIWCFS